MKISQLAPIPPGAYLYLGSPYSNYPHGLEPAHADVCAVAAEFVKFKIPVFAPVAHSHPIAFYGDLDPLDHEMWMAIDTPMMRGAFALVVVKLDGWGLSKGLGQEISFFKNAGKPIVYIDPETLLVSEEP